MSIFGKLAFGTASDRFDNRYLFWVEAGLIILATILLMSDPGYLQMFIICGTLGLAGGGTLPLLGSIVGKRYGPQFFGQAMGLLMPFLTISSFGFVVAGWLRDATGDYDMALMMFLLVMFPALLVMAAMPPLGQAKTAKPVPGE